MKLSVVLTCLDDPDLPFTVRSIRETAGDAIEIIVVLDGSGTLNLSALGNVKFIKNFYRCGVGPSRFSGICAATGDYVLIGDSHLRFLPGWLETTISRLAAHPKTLFCYECRALDKTNMDVNNPVSFYYGGTWRLFGPDPNKAANWHIFEPVWNKEKQPDNAEIACVFGGAYAANRDWMLQIAEPLRHLHYWSDDETVLALQSWLRGGDTRIITATGIGHRFWHQQSKEKQPFTVPVGYPTYNRLLSIHTLLPDDLRDFCLDKMQLHKGGGELSVAKKLIEQNWRVVETARAINRTRFVRDFRWVANKFSIPIPQGGAK